MISINSNMNKLLSKINTAVEPMGTEALILTQIINLPFVEVQGCMFIQVADKLNLRELKSIVNDGESTKADIEYSYNELCLNHFFEKKDKLELIKLGLFIIDGWVKRFESVIKESFKCVLSCSDDESWKEILEADFEADNIVILRIFRVRNDDEQKLFSDEVVQSANLDCIYVKERVNVSDK